jgi:transcriptional regulator with XRE-family HTH domain
MDVSTLQRELGIRIQALRKQRGLTQEELAEAVGRSVDTVSNIERGFSLTRIETALAIAVALKTTLRDLFDLEPLPSTAPEKRVLIDQLIELVRPLDPGTLEALVAQTQILLRVREGAGRKKIR